MAQAPMGELGNGVHGGDSDCFLVVVCQRLRAISLEFRDLVKQMDRIGQRATVS